MRKFAVVFVLVFSVFAFVPAHAGIAKFTYKHAVKPAAHAGVKATKTVGHGAKKSVKFAVKVLW